MTGTNPFSELISHIRFTLFCLGRTKKTRDKRRFQELYPSLARQIQPLVEEACDRMEYEGSLMFDEYPDRLLLRRLSRRICGKLDKEAYRDELTMQEAAGTEWLGGIW